MKTIFGILISVLISVSAVAGQTSDAALRRAIEADNAARSDNGKLPTLTAAEHLSRAGTYMANRLFPQAREHWAIVLENYPEDSGIPQALFGTARSFMWERQYLRAVEWFDRLTKDHIATKDGREGLAFKGASYVRAGKNLEAARTYEQYVAMFPAGERIDSAHLNIIDAYREAGEYEKANEWVDRAAQRFNGTPTAANALQGRVRLEIFRENWPAAIRAADELMAVRSFSGSMTSLDEAKYLKALALERSGDRTGANEVLASIPNVFTSYFGGLASMKLEGTPQVRRISQATARLYTEYPVSFRSQVLTNARKQKIDPRFVMAIMKQESSFRVNAKSPAGARGLIQLVYDTAIKYKEEAGYPRLQPDDLYSPEINVAIGSIYIRKIKDEFGGLYEAVAASYNAGEDNAARWLDRTRPKEPGLFAAEVGFAETKNYVFKVMNNYRIYRELYDENLNRR
jgi:soluble lytic murein transglycosylase-like protein